MSASRLKLPLALWHIYFVGSSPGSCDYQRYKSTPNYAAAGTKVRILTQLLAAQAVWGAAASAQGSTTDFTTEFTTVQAVWGAAAGAQGSLQTRPTRQEGCVRCSHTAICVSTYYCIHAYYSMCVLIPLYTRILLYECPHTTIYTRTTICVSSYYYKCQADG